MPRLLQMSTSSSQLSHQHSWKLGSRCCGAPQKAAFGRKTLLLAAKRCFWPQKAASGLPQQPKGQDLENPLKTREEMHTRRPNGLGFVFKNLGLRIEVS